jgi:flagellar motor switch protein FliN/FliY
MAENQEQAETQEKAQDQEQVEAQEQAETQEEAQAQEQVEAQEQDLELTELEPDSQASQSAVVPGEGVDEDGSLRSPTNAQDLEAVYDIPVQVSAVLGRATMQVSQLLKLGRGAVVELDRKVGEAIDIYVNNRLVARGEVVVVDERLGVTMTEIIKADRT